MSLRWHRRALRLTRASLMGCGVALAVLTPISVHAQCALSARPQPGATGYQKRAYGCEGMYVELQAAPLAVQVVSLVQGDWTIPQTDIAHIAVAAQASSPDGVNIFGRGRSTSLHWALDGVARADAPMAWDLRQVVRVMQFGAEDIGVYGVAQSKGDLAGPMYIPVRISSGATETAPVEAQVIELLIRIPLAGRVRWRLGPGGTPKPGESMDGDGLFAIRIPQWTRGVQSLEVQWSPRGQMRAWSAPEGLRIRFP